MFHLGDLNLMACSFATFAASVGYACTRKIATLPRTLSRGSSRNPNPTDYQSCNTTTQDPPKEHESLGCHDAAVKHESTEPISLSPSQTLKRKRQSDDREDSFSGAGYPHNLSMIYPPKKRSRTPSSETASEISQTPCTDTVECTNTLQEQDNSDLVDILPPTTPEPSPPSTEEPIDMSSPLFGTSSNSPSPPPIFPFKRRIVTLDAFSAFAGPDTPLSKVVSSKSAKPAWTKVGLVAENQDILRLENDCDAFSAIPNDPSCHVLEAAAKTAEPTFKHVTGEENEDVQLELKSVKLFAKRGDQPFSDGLVGQVKLLSHRATLDERLLFRREPLWQVSMNVRMHPSIRCTYDAEENVLRLILKEAIEQKGVPSQDWQRQVVIYALKPGRSCSKQDFKDFALALMKSPGLQAKPQEGAGEREPPPFPV